MSKDNPSQIELANFYGLTNQSISNYKRSKNEKYQRILEALRFYYLHLKQKEEK